MYAVILVFFFGAILGLGLVAEQYEVVDMDEVNMNSGANDSFSVGGMNLIESPRVNYSLIPGHLQDRLLSEGDVYFCTQKAMSETAKQYYLLAAGCGLIAAALDLLWVGDFNLSEAHEWGKDKTEKFVIHIAQKKGYKGDSIKGAIKKLEELNEYKFIGDKATSVYGGGLQHHLRDYSHHFSPIGLYFSLYTQFSNGKMVGTDKFGKLLFTEIEDKTLIGGDVYEKLYNGVVVWFFHLVSDMCGSSGSVGEGTGIPGPILSMIKYFSSTPFAKSISVKYKGDDIGLSTMVSKLFNGTAFKDADHPRGIKFDLRTELGIGNYIVKKNMPNIMVEIITGVMFKIYVFRETLANKKIKDITLGELEEFLKARSLKGHSLSLDKMKALSFGVKNSIEGVHLVIGAAAKGGNVQRAAYLLVNLDYYALGRFIVCTKRSIDQMQTAKKEEIFVSVANDPGIMPSYLSTEQMRILNALLLSKVQYDIDNTKKDALRKKKIEWSYRWQNQMIENEADTLSLRDETKLYDTLAKEITKSDNNNWMYMIAICLSTFEPYFKLDPADSKLKCTIEDPLIYERDVFCKKQSVIDYEDISSWVETYNQSLNEFSGRKESDENVEATYSSIKDIQENISWSNYILSDYDDSELPATSFDDDSDMFDGESPFKGITPSPSNDNIYEFSSRECAKLFVFAKCVLLDRFDNVTEFKNVKYKLDSDLSLLKQAYDSKRENMTKKDVRLYQKLFYPILECDRQISNLMMDPNHGKL